MSLIPVLWFSFAGHEFGQAEGEGEGYQPGDYVGDETAEERVAREAAEAGAQRAAKEGDMTRLGSEREGHVSPTPSQHEYEEDQPPTKKPQTAKKPMASGLSCSILGPINVVQLSEGLLLIQTVKFDAEIARSDEQMKQTRNDYAVRMAAEREKQHAIDAQKEGQKRAEHLFRNPPDKCKRPRVCLIWLRMSPKSCWVFLFPFIQSELALSQRVSNPSSIPSFVPHTLIRGLKFGTTALEPSLPPSWTMPSARRADRGLSPPAQSRRRGSSSAGLSLARRRLRLA